MPTRAKCILRFARPAVCPARQTGASVSTLLIRASLLAIDCSAKPAALEKTPNSSALASVNARPVRYTRIYACGQVHLCSSRPPVQHTQQQVRTHQARYAAVTTCSERLRGPPNKSAYLRRPAAASARCRCSLTLRQIRRIFMNPLPNPRFQRLRQRNTRRPVPVSYVVNRPERLPKPFRPRLL